MDPRFLDYYNAELLHVRDGAAEFAREFPKVAGRLALSDTECADPYVERLLEGFAFLAARLQLRIDAEFPRFTQHLLEIAYPDYLPPTPAMAIARFVPEAGEASLATGFTIERGTALIANKLADDTTSCEFRTAMPVALWPLELTGASYRQYAGELPAGIGPAQPPKAVLRIRLRATAGLKLSQIKATSLPLFLGGIDGVAHRLYEQLLGYSLGYVGMVPGQKRVIGPVHPSTAVQEMGFRDDESLLTPSRRTFQGHRLLQEYLSFPSRFLFVELTGLDRTLRSAGDQTEIELAVLLSRFEPALEGAVSVDDLTLYCSPIINLFPKRADRVHLSDRVSEHHVVPDIARPMDFEVFRVTGITGYGEGIEQTDEFHPFYSTLDHHEDADGGRFYTVSRVPRVASDRQRRNGARTGYLGSEVFVSLVDAHEAPYPDGLKQLAVTTLCTNRDLPLRMPLGGGRTDFTPAASGPVLEVRCVKGPSAPIASHRPGESSWRLISLLAQNYLSLLDTSPESGAQALRELLGILGGSHESMTSAHVSGLRSVKSQQIVRRLPARGPVAFGRGVEVVIEVDEAQMGGSGAFLFGSVLRHYLCRHATLNSFVETRLRVLGRGEVMRWRPIVGARPIL
jgi:type VI secretion system protein ImpG